MVVDLTPASLDSTDATRDVDVECGDDEFLGKVLDLIVSGVIVADSGVFVVFIGPFCRHCNTSSISRLLDFRERK